METDTSAATSGRGTMSHSSDRSSSSQAASQQSGNSGSSSYSAGNPYMSKHMYSSSFMSTEGSQSIQSLIGVQTREELGHSSSSSHAYSQVGVPSSPFVQGDHSPGKPGKVTVIQSGPGKCLM